MGRAQTVLSRDVLAQIEATPQARLPEATWARLSSEQRAMVAELRKHAKDQFVAPERPRASAELKAPAPFAGKDPIGATAPAAERVNPHTGLDPVAMQEIFGGVIDATGLEQFEGQGLLDELRKRFFSRHSTLDYFEARQKMFSGIDNEGGNVKDVYAGRTISNVTGIPEESGPNGFNTEHTWPQSQLKKAGKLDAVSDLHHLFPVEAFANGKRGSTPFGVVKQVDWENGESKLGHDAKGKLVFEPPERHRGDVARAMFWVAMAYELDIPPDEEAVLKAWAKQDPVDDRELRRNLAIAKVQGDENPFVEHPELIDRVDDF